MELGSNSGEDGYVVENTNYEENRLLKLHAATAKVLSEECMLIDDLQLDHVNCIPALSMLAHQKYDLEVQLRALDAERREADEAENYLVTKTIQAEQVYKEWDQWKPAMQGEYQSLVHEKKAVRQMNREQAKAIAKEQGLIYEELPSKVVFARKTGGRYKVRACVCGNFEGPVTAATYAGGCDASQIRCLVRYAGLKAWQIHGTDIKCAFLNAPRQDKTKMVVMTVPHIYVKLGLASPNEIWIIDSAVYGLTTSPRDWSDHRDKQIPDIKWCRSVQTTGIDKPGDSQEVDGEGDGRTCPSDRCYWKSLDPDASCTQVQRTWQGSFVPSKDQHLWHLQEECLETGEVKQQGVMAIYVDDVLIAAEGDTASAALKAISEVWECSKAEQATVEKSLTFCGFEIQGNEEEHGGGYRLHQQSCEEDLVKRWNITRTAMQPVIKLPAAQEDPYNKIHGRMPSPWIDEEEDRSHLVRRAINLGDAPPVRRKKKSAVKRPDSRSDIEKMEQMYQRLVPGGGLERSEPAVAASATSLSRERPSGSAAAASATSLSRERPSGSAAAASATSLSRERPSGSAAAASATSLSRERPSGSVAAASATSLSRERQSGYAAASPTSLSSARASGSGIATCATPAPRETHMSLRSATAEQTPRTVQTPSSSAVGAASTQGESSTSQNPWNEFQIRYSGRHWGSDKMRAEYWKMRATGVWPK